MNVSTNSLVASYRFYILCIYKPHTLSVSRFEPTHGDTVIIIANPHAHSISFSIVSWVRLHSFRNDTNWIPDD